MGLVVVSGAPGAGKSTVAGALGRGLDRPVLSLDTVKETLADCLGLGDPAQPQEWSNVLGDAAAAVLFQLCPPGTRAVVEGWWRGERRDRAIGAFVGALEVFCQCPPELATSRMRARLAGARHPIHRDMIDPSLLDAPAPVAGAVRPLHLGGPLVVVDTSSPDGWAAAVAQVVALIGTG